MDYRTKLSELSRKDLNIIAEKLKIKNYSQGIKEKLVESIVSTRTPKQIKQVVSPSLWNRYHNHIYGVASILGVILTIWALLPKPHQENQRLTEPPTITSPNSSEPMPQPIQSAPHSSPTPTPSPTKIFNLSSSQKRQPAQMTETASDHINRARALLGREQLDAALAECNRALRLEPKNQTAIDLKNSINALYKLQKQKQ